MTAPNDFGYLIDASIPGPSKEKMLLCDYVNDPECAKKIRFLMDEEGSWTFDDLKRVLEAPPGSYIPVPSLDGAPEILKDQMEP